MTTPNKWYRFAQGAIQIDGATEVDMLIATAHPITGDILFVPTASSSVIVGASPVTEDDGAGGFELVFDDDGNIVYDV